MLAVGQSGPPMLRPISLHSTLPGFWSRSSKRTCIDLCLHPYQARQRPTLELKKRQGTSGLCCSSDLADAASPCKSHSRMTVALSGSMSAPQFQPGAT